MRTKTFAIDIDGTMTEDNTGRIHLGALSALRYLSWQGHNVIFVTGRSSVEAYMLAVFGGTTPVSVGENGGCITTANFTHRMLGDMQECQNAFEAIKSEFKQARQKPVFPRMTEVVLERTFDLEAARALLSDKKLPVVLSDSLFSYHINSAGIDKAAGFMQATGMTSADKPDIIAIGDSITDVPLFKIAGISVAPNNASEEVKSAATVTAGTSFGAGVVEALNLLASRHFEV